LFSIDIAGIDGTCRAWMRYQTATLEIALRATARMGFFSEDAMHAWNRCSRLLMYSAAVLLIAACSRQEDPPEQVSDAAAEATHAIGTEPWVNDVRVSSSAPAGSTAQALTPGTELELTMSVEKAPQGTVVTAYWYGPEDRQLAYESQTVEPKQRQMNFTQENTHDWPAGTYRAEVWVDNNKVQEQNFQIAAG
jgi:hypothetical protein